MVIKKIRIFIKKIANKLNIYKKLIRASKDSAIQTKFITDKPKVHIGCGNINLSGWINIDARHMPHVHIVSQDLKLDEFSDNSIGEIYLSHMLEHISFSEVNILLRKFHQKLASNGVLRVSVPSFESIIKIYISNGCDIETIKYALMGGQDYELNFHRSVFDRRSLSKLMISAGFAKIDEWKTEEVFGQDLGDWSNRTFFTADGEVMISLNLCAHKK